LYPNITTDYRKHALARDWSFPLGKEALPSDVTLRVVGTTTRKHRLDFARQRLFRIRVVILGQTIFGGAEVDAPVPDRCAPLDTALCMLLLIDYS
jgi:hypothetical protein